MIERRGRQRGRSENIATRALARQLSLINRIWLIAGLALLSFLLLGMLGRPFAGNPLAWMMGVVEWYFLPANLWTLGLLALWAIGLGLALAWAWRRAIVSAESEVMSEEGTGKPEEADLAKDYS